MGRGESLLLRETKYHSVAVMLKDFYLDQIINMEGGYGIEIRTIKQTPDFKRKKIPHEPPRLAMGDSEYRDTTLSRGMEAKVQINQHKKEKNDSKLKRAFKPATLFYYHFLLSAA